VQKIAAHHLGNVRAKLAHLQRMESMLAASLARCPGDTSPDCPVLEMLEAPDARSANGSNEHRADL
jgi:MerR family mercuric resistance operon transcriptional regulator